MGEWLRTIVDLTYWCSLVLPILYLIKYKGAPSAYKYFTYYLLSIGILQVLQKYWVRLFDTSNNLVLFKFYLFFEFLFLTLFLRSLIKKKWPMWLFIVVLALLLLKIVIDGSFGQTYNEAGIALTHLALIVMSLSYLYRSLSSQGKYVGIVAGLLLYLPISTITFLAGNLIFDPEYAQTLSVQLITINTVAYFVLQLLFIFIWFRWLRRPSFHSS